MEKEALGTGSHGGLTFVHRFCATPGPLRRQEQRRREELPLHPHPNPSIWKPLHPEQEQSRVEEEELGTARKQPLHPIPYT